MCMFCLFHNMFLTVITKMFVKLSPIRSYRCTRYNDVNFQVSCRLNRRHYFMFTRVLIYEIVEFLC